MNRLQGLVECADPRHEAGAAWQREVEVVAFTRPCPSLVGVTQEERVFREGVAVDGDAQHIGALVEDGLGAVAVVVVHIEDGHALATQVPQRLCCHGGVVEKAVTPKEIRASVVPWRAGEGEGAARPCRQLQGCGHGAGRSATGRRPCALSEWAARVECKGAHARGKVVGQGVGAKAVAVGHGPDRGQGVALCVGRVHGHPLGPGTFKKTEVALGVHAGQHAVELDVADLRRQQLAKWPLAQGGHHEIQTRRYLVAVHHATTEHFLVPGVQ